MFDDWPQYKSHRVVRAMPITEITTDTGIIIWWIEAPNGFKQRFEPTEIGMKQRAKVGDYAMVYDDGYQSVCPKVQFEAGYSLL